MSTELEQATQKLNKADNLFKVSLGTFIAFLVGMFMFVSFQLYTVQNVIAENQKINADASRERFQKYTEDNAQQHKITRAYVKCVTTSLLVPIDQRDENLFDNCSQSAQTANQ